MRRGCLALGILVIEFEVSTCWPTEISHECQLTPDVFTLIGHAGRLQHNDMPLAYL